MMNTHEQTPPEDALEQRLRRHLAATYGPPPATDDVWQRLAVRLTDSAPDGRPSALLGPSTHPFDPSAGPAQPAPRQDHPRAFTTPAMLPALAAVLLIAVLAAVILGPLRPHGAASPTPTPSATPIATASPHAGIPLPTSAPGQYQVHILQPDELVPGVSFVSMRVFPSGEGWAVGQKRTGPSSYESAIYHLKDGRWFAASEVFPNVSLSTLSMLSPTEGWAAGVLFDTSAPPPTPTPAQQPVVLHYSGGHWAPVTPPSGVGSIARLAMVSPTEGWAIQYGIGAATTTTLLHYQHGAWSVFDTGGLQLTTLAMVSPTEGWAAGLDGAIAHYQHGRWTRWPTSTPGDVTTITMTSATDGWMSGFIPPADPNSGTPAQSFTLHYDGHDWRPVAMPALPSLPPDLPNVPVGGSSLDSAVTSFSMLSPAEGWAAGDNHGAVGVIYHYTGGSWHLENVAVSESLASIAMVSPDEGWALGGERIITNGDEAAVILHYSHGVWSIYKP